MWRLTMLNQFPVDLSTFNPRVISAAAKTFNGQQSKTADGTLQDEVVVLVTPPGRRSETLAVTVPSGSYPKNLPELVQVAFVDLVVSQYTTQQGRTGLSCRAASVHALQGAPKESPRS
jgi:hypothetical protein